MRRMLFLIDPQRGFTDPNIREDYRYDQFLYDHVQELYVPGAEDDSIRTAAMINAMGSDLNDITVTLDSHYINHIANYTSWLINKATGGWVTPDPFSVVKIEDVENGVYKIRNKALEAYSKDYVRKLKAFGRNPLMLWPLHCLIGTPGFCIDKHILAAIIKWEVTTGRTCIRVTKGSNYKTEHYSAVMADVPDPQDPSTSINKNLISMLEGKTVIRKGAQEILEYDEILTAGQAKGNCLKFTVEDVANHISPDVVSKFTLLEDATSPVPGTEKASDAFVQDMVHNRGMKLANTTDYI